MKARNPKTVATINVVRGENMLKVAERDGWTEAQKTNWVNYLNYWKLELAKLS